jgi:hypothetical protein
MTFAAPSFAFTDSQGANAPLSIGGATTINNNLTVTGAIKGIPFPRIFEAICHFLGALSAVIWRFRGLLL